MPQTIAFRLTREHDMRSIAIPAVGTGIAGFPMDECARVMAGCLREALVDGWSPDEVRFVLFGEPAKQAFEGPFVAAFGVILAFSERIEFEVGLYWAKIDP